MRIVLDTNEFIFALGVSKKPACAILLNHLLESFPKHSIHIPRTIVNETKDNLAPIIFAEFIRGIQKVAVIDEDIFVPFEIGMRYETLGLKATDAFIAAYAEWTGAELLVTENRHFLSRQANLPFKVLTAEAALKLLGK